MENFRQFFKLPNIKFGSVDHDHPNFDTHLWASNERNNIAEILKNGNIIDAKDWLKLKQYLLCSLKEANNGNKLNIWQELHTHLLALVPLSELISQDKEIMSVLRSVAKRIHDNIEWSYLLPGMADTISSFIPSEINIKLISTNENPEQTLIKPIIQKKTKKAPSTTIMPEDVNNWFIDPVKGDLFDPSTLDTYISIKAKKIKMKDILSAIGTVGKEIIMSESAFDRPFEHMIHAMNIDMSRFGYSDICGIDARLDSADEYFDCENTVAKREETISLPEKKGADLLPPPRTGREAVSYMIKCFHLKEMRLAYFNIKSQRIVDYYDLTAVPKHQMEKEHFIFSSIGIIHHQNDGTGIAMSLTDWYKESVLYNALLCIPFIRSFLVRKYFQSWKIITVHHRHLRKGKYLENKLLMANVVFGKSLLQIVKLLEEVSNITLVPKMLECTQTEVSFLKEFSHVSKSADVYLEKFYRYIKIVVNETVAESYKHLQFCQAQAHNIYLYSEDCIYKKKLKQQERAEALRRSLNQVYQLGDFVRLINYLLNNKIVEITLHNIVLLAELMCSMGEELETRKHSTKEAIFQTNMGIKTVEGENQLSLSPTVADIESMFTATISGIPQLILRHCYPLNGLLSSEYLNRYKEMVNQSSTDHTRVPRILSSKAESRVQMMDECKISRPELPFIELPSKSEDNLRVATPPLVNPDILNKSSLTVFGQGIPSKFTPMSSNSVFGILDSNPVYEDLIGGFKELFSETSNQIDLMCKDNEWLLDVRLEYEEWSQINMTTDWEGLSPYIFEQRLGKVKSFLHQLGNIELSVTIPNRIFIVSLSSMLSDLISEMEFELDSIFGYILGRVRTLGTSFIGDITTVLEILRIREMDADSFTRVAMHIIECRERSGDYQTSMDYIKLLFDVLRATDKSLRQTDKDIEDQVTSLWESFLFQLQEANEFINNERANVVFAIKSRIQVLEEAARSIETSLNDVLYSTLSDDSLTIIANIDAKLNNMDTIRSETDLLMVSYQSLQAEPYNRVVNMDDIVNSATFLKSQWSFLCGAKDQVEAWKKTLFSQFDVPASLDVILEWQKLIVDIRSNKDHKSSIVKEIEEIIGEFASYMPLFGKLSSPLFQLEHWQRFFADIGHNFIDPFETLTVEDLIVMDIRQYTQMIDVLFSNAVLRNKALAEFEHQFRFWMTREFEFLRHVPETWFKRKHEEKDARIARQMTSLRSPEKSGAEIFYENKALSEKIEKLSRLPITNNRETEIFLVTEWTRLYEDITDSVITLQGKHTADTREKRINYQHVVLLTALNELRRLCDVLQQCQEKWMFLERIFEEECFVASYQLLAVTFQEVNKEMISSLSMMHYNPNAVQYTKLGQIFLAVKSVNNYHAELVHRLVDLLRSMNSIISSLDSILNHARNLFPRLYFVPDQCVVRALSTDISHDIRQIIPIVTLCFPSINNVTNTDHQSELSLAIESISGENVPLIKELPSINIASQWLKELELMLKSTMKVYVASCVGQQMTEVDKTAMTNDGSQFFLTERPKSTVFDEIDQIESLASRMPKAKQLLAGELVHDILSHYQSWLLRYPLQALLLAEKIIFYKALKVVINNKPDTFLELREKLIQKETNFVRLNKELRSGRNSRVAVEHLLLQNKFHIDVLDKLLEEEDVCLDSFTYKSLVKYDLDLDDSRIGKSSGVDVCDDVRIEVFSSRYMYEYEYIDAGGCQLVNTAVTERAVLNMLLALHNYEIGTIVGDSRSCKQTLIDVSQILGRNMFSTFCNGTTSPSLVQRYMTGALLSGSIVHFDGVDQLQTSMLSGLSRDLWNIRRELETSSHGHILSRKIRLLSASSNLTNIEMDDVLNVSPQIVPKSDRDGLVRNRIVDGLQLNKEKTWPCHSDDDIVSSYSPRVLGQIHLFNSLLDIRHGFGVFSTVLEQVTLQKIPLSLKTQMRIHFLIPIDETLLVKQCLTLAGKDHCDELMSCITLFLERIEELLPTLSSSTKKLLPLVVSKCNWTSNNNKFELGRNIFDMIICKYSPDRDSKDVLREIINNCFDIGDDVMDNVIEDSSALVHQIKSQLRIRGLKVSQGFITKIVELRNIILLNKVTYVVGHACTGKTVSIDVLSTAVNSLYSSAQRILSGSKKRGAIEVLKTISLERKPQIRVEEYDEPGQRRIYLIRLALSNFSAEEMSPVSVIQAKETLGALTTIIRPLLKSATTERFQIWLHVDHNLGDESVFVYPLQSLFENESSVKIIVELNSSSVLQLQSNPDLVGLVHMEPIPDLWKIILKRTIKQILAQKLITYYGCKFLVECGEMLFQKLFDRFDLQLKCCQDEGVHINCVLQTLCVLEIMLLEYAMYHPDERENNLPDIEKKYKSLFSFAVIQGARGTLYSVLIGQRLLSHDEFEDNLKNILAGQCEIRTNGEDFNAGIFGLMLDFNGLAMKPFEEVKGCKLPQLWSNSDGVGKHVLHLMVKYKKSVAMNGSKNKIESLLDTVRFNKRLHLTKGLSINDLRQCLHETNEQYWNIVSNEDPLVTKPRENDIIVLERFFERFGPNHFCDSFLPFVLEHKYCFDGELFDKKRTDEAVIILARYGTESNQGHHNSKFTRFVTEINIVDPAFSECRHIVFRSLNRWLQKVEKHKLSLTKVVSKCLADFVVDIAVSLRQHRIQRIITMACDSSPVQSHIETVYQVTWSQLCKVIKSLTSVHIDVLQQTIRNLEKIFPLEKTDSLKRYKTFAIYVRIIRHSIFEISRAFFDGLESPDEKEMINHFINDSIQRHLCQTISPDIDDMILKHFPVPVAKMTDIILWPCRVIDVKSYDSNSDVNYHPVVEAHCWQMMNLAQETICDSAIIKHHLATNPQIITMVKTSEYLSNLMKIYKYMSHKNCRDSALFVQYSSSTISGKDYGVFLSGLLPAVYIRPEDILQCNEEVIRSAVRQSGRMDQRVILHIDCSCVKITNAIYEFITQILSQDSITPLLHYITLPHLHQYVRQLHEDLYITTGSAKEIRLAKAFLENVQRNLRIFVTCNTAKLSQDDNLRNLSTYFQETDLNYLFLEEYHESILKESIDSMIGHSSSAVSSLCATVHHFFAGYFPRFENSFGSAFSVTGRHLKLVMALFNYLYKLFAKSIKDEMDFYNSAIESVNFAWNEIDAMKDLRKDLQDDLRKLNEEVEISGNSGKNMRDSYANALLQCKNQEKKVGELFGPLNEMKEKSKTNFDEVSPTYLAALETIRNLDPDAIEEIKTYVKPPQQVRDLIGAIFDLLGYETRWELIKERMVKINLYEELLYLDKDHISDTKFKELEQRLLDPQLRTEHLETVSRAAASLSRWLTAVYRYSSLNKEINPQLGQLLSCQDQINRAQTELGKMRVRADQMRQDLEKKIAEHKDLLANRKNVADNLKNINYKINSGTNLLSDLSSHSDNWKKEEAALTMEMKNLSTNVLKTVIRCVYLNKLPHSLRTTVMEPLRHLGFDFKASEYSRILQEQHYHDLLSEDVWSSLQRSSLTTAVEMSSIIFCPGVSYPDLGSIIIVHCCKDNNDGRDGAVTLISAVLESPIIRTRFEHNSESCITHSVDCCKCSPEEIDRILSICIEQGEVLVLEKVDLLSQLSPGLMDLLNKETNPSAVHPRFRLLLVSSDGYSNDAASCCKLLRSERFLHFNFSLGQTDFQNHLENVMIQSCEPELFQSIINCDVQKNELNRSSLAEKNILVNIASSCIKDSSKNGSSGSDKLSTVSEKTSLLEVDGLHSIILRIDSKILTFDESRDSIKEKEKGLLTKLEKYKPIIDYLIVLLDSFSMFLLEKVMVGKNDGENTRTMGCRLSITTTMAIIKEVASASGGSIVMRSGCDPEITSTFLEKLQLSIVMKLLNILCLRMESSDVFNCLLEFCVEKIIGDSDDIEDWNESEKKFIKSAILCLNTDELMMDVSSELMDLSNLSPDGSVSKQMLQLSLVLETNIVVLGGLTKSLIIDNHLWKEYFQFPFLSCNSVPGFDMFHQPPLLLKAVIWRVLNPGKMEQVKHSLIADVFGEEIFKFNLLRNHQLELIVSACRATQPIIVSTLKNAMSGIESPLEVITRIHDNLKEAVKMHIIDCASKTEISHLISQSSDESGPYINHLLKDPCWLVLSNFHLCSSNYFSCEYFKVIIKNNLQRTLRKLHPDSRLFLTLEIDSLVQYPESLLNIGQMYHCSPEIDLDVAVQECKLSCLDNGRQADILAILHSGIFSNTVFKYNCATTNADYKLTVKISSKIRTDGKSLMRVVDLVYKNKIGHHKLRQVFDGTISEMSHSIGSYDNHQLSKVTLKKDFYDRLGAEVFQHIDMLRGNKTRSRKSNEAYCLVDQRAVDILKAGFIEVMKQLLCLIEEPIVAHEVMALHHRILRLELLAVLRQMLMLPIWHMRSISISRFDDLLSRSDIRWISDQQFLSNDIIPDTWTWLTNFDSVSQWLQNMRDVEDKCRDSIMNPRLIVITDVTETVRKYFQLGRL